MQSGARSNRNHRSPSSDPPSPIDRGVFSNGTTFKIIDVSPPSEERSPLSVFRTVWGDVSLVSHSRVEFSPCARHKTVLRATTNTNWLLRLRHITHIFLMMLATNIVIVVILSACQLCSAHFGYSKPEQKRWAHHHSHCAGKRQSPIAVHSEMAIPLPIPAIEMVGYHNLLPGPIQLHNNGHSVSLSLPAQPLVNGTGERLPFIFGGLLRDEYELEGLHFHWGDKNNRGSEHIINDMRYPMEMHIIHRNVRYATMAQALQHADGLCVLGFMFQISEHNSPELRNIMRNMDEMRHYNKKVDMGSTFALHSLLGDLDTDMFYTYRGSLTTPPCREAVTWVLYTDTLPVTRAQMNKFRRITNAIDSVLVDNYRDLQSTGDRRVFVRKMNTRRTELDEVRPLDFDESKWYIGGGGSSHNELSN